ncbi:type II toxin-antitoxin system VapC family toxin [Azospirillum sp.]|uniref:type II toxin-antitoxin system VapC family toxin n=1 Tax=Azospirillum sp. TaxID=34012 RepID=UPI002D609370|nr:type II toxin-antitoxin system VapC family toxin [Azospirillum sp.]HYD67667.1 type II toxin-antitoxin system VapC family toxin [Azospirillum sp.]
MIWVVDASVALKWFLDEEGSEHARRLKSLEEVIAPDLIVAEVSNAAWRLAVSGRIPMEQYQSMAGGISQLVDALWPLSALASRAAEMAGALRHPVYDCFYTALAEVKATKVITADRRFLNAIYGSRWRDLAIDLYSY